MPQGCFIIVNVNQLIKTVNREKVIVICEIHIRN